MDNRSFSRDARSHALAKATCNRIGRSFLSELRQKSRRHGGQCLGHRRSVALAEAMQMVLAFYRRHVEQCADDLIELYGEDARDLASEQAQDEQQEVECVIGANGRVDKAESASALKGSRSDDQYEAERSLWVLWYYV